MRKFVFLLSFLVCGCSFIYAEGSSSVEQTTNYLRNGSFEHGMNLDWEYYVSEKSNAKFSLSEEYKILEVGSIPKVDVGDVGLRVDVNSVENLKSVYARTHVTVGADSLYLLQFWAHGPENAQIYVEIEGCEQKGVLYEMRIGNGNNEKDPRDSKGKMVAFHYPFKVNKSNLNRELAITFYFRSTTTKEKSNNPNNCSITSSPGVTYFLDGLVLVDQNNDMHHDVFNTYLWNYNQVPNTNKQSWTAGDNDVSFDLPDGRRMWIFNDSFYGSNKVDTNVFPGGTFVRNCVVIQELDGSLRALPTSNQGGQNTYFRIPDKDVIYNIDTKTGKEDKNSVKNIFWVGDALIEDNQVKVYLIEVYGNDRSYIGKFSYPELEFLGIEEQAEFCRTYEKFFVEDDMIYLYANDNEGMGRNMKVARTFLGNFSGHKAPWEFWNGTAWVNDKTQAVRVSPRGADAVMKLGEGNYVQLAMPSMDPRVYVRFAPSPEGPWGHETLVGIGDLSANFWYYMPNFHGQLPNGKFSISMSANYHGCLFFCKDCENQLYVDKYWYRPRYIQADLLGLSPYTKNKKDCAGVENGIAYLDDCEMCVGGTTGLEPCSNLTGVCELYADAGYAAKVVGLKVGEYTSADLTALGFEPNTLSSFKLDQGYAIELYSNDNFQGNMKLFNAAISNLETESFDNQTASLIIRRVGLENLDGTYTIQNKQSELYMGIEGNSLENEALVVQEAYTGDKIQQFELKHLGKGYYSITNKQSNKPLSVLNQSTKEKAYIEQWEGKEANITSRGGLSAQYPEGGGLLTGLNNLTDKDINTKCTINRATAWVQFKTSTPYVLSSYRLTSAADTPNRDPHSWTLSGSNDETEWTILDTQSEISFARSEEKMFSVTNNTAYAYYRINMTSTKGNVLQLAEWKLYASTGKPDGGYLDSQQFIIQDAGNGFVRIINKASDMLLEIFDGFVDEGAKVWQANDPKLGGFGTLWKLKKQSDTRVEDVVVENKIVVYPNPAINFVTIGTKELETIEQIVITDLSGKTISDKLYNNDSQVTIPLSGWSNGVYVVRIYTNEGSYSHKIIKL